MFEVDTDGGEDGGGEKDRLGVGPVSRNGALLQRHSVGHGLVQRTLVQVHQLQNGVVIRTVLRVVRVPRGQQLGFLIEHLLLHDLGLRQLVRLLQPLEHL